MQTSRAKPKGRHGGRRSGAGAPRGNLNAIKHGLYSQQLHRIAQLFAAEPGVVRFWSQYQTKVGNYNALEARAVVVATTFLRSGGAEDTAALRAALQPLSKRALRRLANTLAGEIIKN